MAPETLAQRTPYIGFVYPAGGQQGTTAQVRLGGQNINDIIGATVTGEGVSAKLVKYYRQLNNQEVTVLREQLRELKKKSAKRAKPAARKKGGKQKGAQRKKPLQKGVSRKRDSEEGGMKGGGKNAWQAKQKLADPNNPNQKMMEALQQRISSWVNKPANRSLSSIAVIEVTIAPDAKPGSREIRLVTARGVTNPMVFEVGQVPEIARKPMKTCAVMVLGKEHLAQRKRPEEEIEERVTVPCTMNGQIAFGEVNRYRFQARKGQRLVISAHARHLLPYIADAVPGWFQAVLTLCDADGKEVAYNDDYRQNPDPVIYHEVAKDGEYVLTVSEALYRGREDYVYRVTIGELPFVTSIFPLGARVGEPVEIEMNGWNLRGARLKSPPWTAKAGVHLIAAKRKGVVSNYLPFALDTLPECFDEESNNDQEHAQEVELPIIVNGRMDRPDDWDVFQIEGRAGDTIVAEVTARRLASPMDSMLKLTDATGKLLALNDDHADPESGLNTHHADSYFMVKLPADGTYYVHLGETTRNGGKEYAYRLRISAPQPSFALRVVPSRIGLRRKGAAAVDVHAIRKEGFTGPIKVSLKDSPEGFSSSIVTIPENKKKSRFVVKTKLRSAKQPVNLFVEGHAKIHEQDIVRNALPAENRMQAFLWRHIVPAEELKALVYDPSFKPPATRVRDPDDVLRKRAEREKKAEEAKKKAAAAGVKPETEKPKFTFTKKQVAWRLKQLQRLYEEWLLTDDFYDRKVAECEGAL